MDVDNISVAVVSSSSSVGIVLDGDMMLLLVASTWERERSAWDFKGSGEGSGIWKSVDGGSNWTKVSRPASGFPTGEGVGRIGLAAAVEV